MTKATAKLRRLLLLPLLACGGCAHEEHATGDMRIALASPDAKLEAFHRVTLDGKHVAWLKSFRFDGDAGRVIRRVDDLKGDALGYVEDTGRAYRYTAHEGALLVAHNDRIEKNVAAVLGASGGSVVLTPETVK